MRSLVITALALVVGGTVVGCTVDAGAGRTCTQDSECARTARCYRGFCIPNDAAAVDSGVDGGPTCTAIEPAEACDDAGMGVCAAGRVVSCTDGTMRCESLAEAGTEICNGMDDDCDGTPDDGIPLDTEENCGGCGASCGTGLACCAAHDASGFQCVDTTSDEEFCGGCGATQVCDTAAGEQCCGSSCQNLLEDEANCGVCGRECPGGQSCCGGECVDPDSDPDHCGGCGAPCATGQECCRGMCDAPTSSRCMACAEDCASMGMACCSGTCVDLETDSNHCGACPTECGTGEFCCGGDCVTDDETHCGACGVTCDADELCCAGGCVANNSPNCGSCGTTCETGTTCCGNGCFNLATDVAHCGTCDTVCAGGTPICSNGHCCPTGQTWCSGAGACVNLLSDNRNCGSCGHSCALGCNGRGACNLL